MILYIFELCFILSYVFQDIMINKQKIALLLSIEMFLTGCKYGLSSNNALLSNDEGSFLMLMDHFNMKIKNVILSQKQNQHHIIVMVMVKLMERNV